MGSEPGKRISEYVAESYDPISNRFILTAPPLDKGLSGASANVIMAGPNRKKVLVAGGSAEWGARHTTELYDPATNRFNRGPNLIKDRTDHHTATDVGEGEILIADAGSSEIYLPRLNSFVPGPRMQVERTDLTATVISSGRNARKILFAGGFIWASYDEIQSGDYLPHNEGEIYDPANNRFDLGPPVNVGRSRHTATAITSGPNAGKILLTGGYNDRMLKDYEVITVPLASTELYDPATNTFAPRSATATMIIPRASHR
ncbi:MAG TPA: kelch repeat-containing protein [Candidatus Binataceae bacterium]|nr:kelch repeat-containing protein [Candidatus Binataceae bacterium]